MEKSIIKEDPKPISPPVRGISKSDLFEIHIFSDQKAGEIKQFIPVNLRGIQDPLRKVLYSGACVIATPMGHQTIEFPIEAESLDQALDAWPNAASLMIKDTQEKWQTAQRAAFLHQQAQSQGRTGRGPRR